jgi:hypothetical protein
MDNTKAAFRHLSAAIQVLRRSEVQLSPTGLANMVPVYDVILRLDFLAQKLVPYAGSSFSRCPDLAFMERPFWNSQSNEDALITLSNSIMMERHRLMQLVCGQGSQVVWGSWHPISERPSRGDLLGFYSAMMMWKATSPATFGSCPGLEHIQASSFEELHAFPIPPRHIQLTSIEAAVNIILFNACLGCALSMITTTDLDPTAREVEAFNLAYRNICISASLIYKDSERRPSNYNPCDTIDLGISIFLYHGARRCFSMEWLQWTMEALRSIGREGLCNAYAAANTIEIMRVIDTAEKPHQLSFQCSNTQAAPLGWLHDRIIPLLMPRREDSRYLAYYLRYGATESDNSERTIRIVGQATWTQNESGTIKSVGVETYHSTDARAFSLSGESGTNKIFSSWREMVKDGWHGFL